MKDLDRKKHWENIYQTKQADEVSWYQTSPEVSLNFLEELEVPKTAKIIDVGGGDSLFADHLLELGYTNISVLDISETAIEKAKERLGKKAEKVKWILADAADFTPEEEYDFWHDRATFHFLTNEREISRYIETAQKNIHSGGYLVLGTFSEQGPKKCSGIEIKQYSETTITERLKGSFKKVHCFTIDHKTPFEIFQNFLFCSFRKMN